MKKFIAFLMALLMVASLCGCRGEDEAVKVIEATEGSTEAAVDAAEDHTEGHHIVSLMATEVIDPVTKGSKETTEATEATEGTAVAPISGNNIQVTENGSSEVEKPYEGGRYYEVVEEGQYIETLNPADEGIEETKPTGDYSEPVKLTETAPTEPVKPTEPTPTEPVKPTEPTPTEPVTPSEPAPTEPAPTEPDPTEPEPTGCCHAWCHLEEETSTQCWIVCQCGWVCHGYDLAPGGVYAGMSFAKAWDTHLSQYSIDDQLDYHASYRNEHLITVLEEERWVCLICGEVVYEDPNS